ncbi:MAG: hypothetical protein JRH07_07210 [Deltaproteobacteria bacterium]|nr:hypothetical protein [Deltaproteobacteria bacterium]MBW2121618.1 hypothetical protein [Deltaproteobacteria bacterium]
MGENRETAVFKARLSSIKEELRILMEANIIDYKTYMDFCFLASNAMSLDQLDELTHDLAEIRQRKVSPR